MKTEFLDALVREINLTPAGSMLKNEGLNLLIQDEKETISTLYFGGGTPSILDKEELALIFSALKNKFVFSAEIEITLEANPDDITEEKLAVWQSLGINRLSVGIQSFLKDELIWMNRAHNAEEALACIDKVQAAGFNNFSVDLIYGSPLLSDEDWKKTIDLIIKKNITHISCYALTVEPKTALEKMIALHKKENIDPERQANQFLILMQRLTDAGYEHYEISNFAKPGFRSKHNSNYWLGKPYYGFGPSAHSYSFVDSSIEDTTAIRKWNVANNVVYIQSLQNNNIPCEEEILTKTQQLNEYIMTSLRTMEGIDLEYIQKKFGESYTEQLITKSAKYIARDKIIRLQHKLVLNREGKLFADGIAADLFF